MLRRRVPGVLVGCLVLLCGAGTAHAAPLTPAQALTELNAWRGQAGLPALTQMYGPWNDACHAHNVYMGLNGFGHGEDPAKPGYTAEGAEAGPASNLFYVSGGQAAGPRIFDGAVYHRVSLLEPRLRISGWDAVGTYGCVRHTGSASLSALDNTPAGRAAGLEAHPWPADGQTGVPRQFGNDESPDPHADAGVSGTLGYLLSLTWNGPWSNPYYMSTDVTAATLTPAGGGAPIPVGISDRDAPNGPYIAPGFALLPRAPLAANTTYTATASGTVGGRDPGLGQDLALPFNVAWRFTTGTALLPPSSTPAPPAPAPVVAPPAVPAPSAPAPPVAASPAGSTNRMIMPAAHVPALRVRRAGRRLIVRGRIRPAVKGLRLTIRARVGRRTVRAVARERADGGFTAALRVARHRKVSLVVSVPAAAGRHAATQRRLTVRP
jgi:hypothetical protein